MTYFLLLSCRFLLRRPSSPVPVCHFQPPIKYSKGFKLIRRRFKPKAKFVDLLSSEAGAGLTAQQKDTLSLLISLSDSAAELRHDSCLLWQADTVAATSRLTFNKDNMRFEGSPTSHTQTVWIAGIHTIFFK